MNLNMNLNDISKKWQEKWLESKVYESNVSESPKFYLTAAFPYPNSPQHIGHARTYTITDVYARYKRMRGFNVLFAMGFHVTGTPIMGMAKKIQENDEELMDIFVNVYGMDRNHAKTLTNPEELVMYFSKEIEMGMKEIGFAIDWRRKFYTFDKEFNSYIVWQFHKLKEMGLISKGNHPVPYCAKCNNAVGGHDTKGDVDPELGEFICLKFKFEEGYILTGTLRPETIYGITNLWIKKDEKYVKIKMDNEICYVSKYAVEKFKIQEHNVEVLSELTGDYFIGKTAENEYVNKKIEIINADFVDPFNATGIVMSVPSHAPFDYVALVEAVGKQKTDEMCINIIESPDLKGIPAKSVVESMGISKISDEKLDEATKVVYRRELLNGRMSTGEFKGLKVEVAREKVKEKLLSESKAIKLHEILNRPVYCRCGGMVEVKIFDDQWFINYNEEEWKVKARKCLNEMNIIPEKRKKDLEYAINWLHEKACTRATGLGTKFPFDEGKMIEALSDSTIYMAFYTVKHLLKKPLSLEEWDYVILGKGNFDELRELRESFNYWYPLDSNHSGADLVYNHLPFFIFNHAGILSEDKWPKGIVLNGFVLMDGQKMSKSLGNILPLRKAVKEYGADAIRISVTGNSDIGENTDFNQNMVDGIISKLYFMNEISNNLSNSENKWLDIRFRKYAKECVDNYEVLDLRNVVNNLIYKLTNDIKWSVRRGHKVNRKMYEEWLKLMTPLAPHFCEEMWHKIGNETFIVNEQIEKYEFDENEYERENEKERIVEEVVNDINEIKKLLNKTPEKAYLFVASEFKRAVFRKIEGGNVNEIIKNVMKDEDIKKRGKEAMGIIKSGTKWKKSNVIFTSEEEREVIEGARKFIEEETATNIILVYEEEAEESMNERAQKSLPAKPSIFFV